MAWSLECGACGESAEAGPLATVCGRCEKPLLVRYEPPGNPDSLASVWSARRGGMWRFREILPLRDGEEPISLGEGGTPLLPLGRLSERLGLRVYAKDEGRNPTGSFKDRGLGAAVTRAVLDGATRLVVPSAGNAAAALAAYSARAGLAARIYIPNDTPEGVERRCVHYGADLVRVDGLIDECGRLAQEYTEATGAFNVSTLREPYRLEGKKTMMLEIVEALDWSAPDAIVYPTGGGTGLIGSWKALGELVSLGILSSRTTRLYAVQGEGCAPIVRAFSAGQESATRWEDAATRAWGLRVPAALGDFLILQALSESGGGAVAVSDEAMVSAAEELGRAGVSASIEGGATLAAARVLLRAGELAEGESVILFNTANLLTY